jgi:hypothetical protein
VPAGSCEIFTSGMGQDSVRMKLPFSAWSW